MFSLFVFFLGPYGGCKPPYAGYESAPACCTCLSEEACYEAGDAEEDSYYSEESCYFHNVLW